MTSESSDLRISLFGPFDVRVHGRPLPPLRSRKGQWLLALLVLRNGREVQREWLADALWPDSLAEEAFTSLRQSLADLRRALGEEARRLQSPTSRTLCLDLTGAEVDVLAFDAAISRGDPASLERAVALYRGPLLEGCAEVWVLSEREAREQAYLQALETLAAAAMAQGDHGAAVRYLRPGAAIDPLRQGLHQSLMRALGKAGQYQAAVEVYQELRRGLHREFNAEPDAETTALYRQIRAEAAQKAKAGGSTAIRVDESRKSSPAEGGRSLALPELPAGTVTFLFTDVEGSTRLWEQHPDAMMAALLRHDALLAEGIQRHGGVVVKNRGEGDSLFAVFARASAAVAAAGALQQALCSEPWPTPTPLRVRVALHTGEADWRDGDYYGAAVNRCARLRAIARGGQVLLSLATEELVRQGLPEGASLLDLGVHRLQDLAQPERVFQLAHPDLPGDFPPLRSLDALPNNLPRQLTSFIGREREMTEIKRLLSTTYLLTLTGTGGCGKTRLSLQVAADLLEEYADGVWLAELAPLADPALVPQTVASALRVREEWGRPLTQALVDYLRPKRLLLVLDNCEHLLSACAQLAEGLLRACPGLRILASSREGLGIAGELTYRVPSLSLPDLPRLPPPGADPVPALMQYEAVRLFVERAVFSQPGFVVKSSNAPALVQVCHRLDGIPLAIELAAARVKALPLEQIAARLDDRFRLLTGGSRTALPRQQTLRAAIDWSYDLLSEKERLLLCRLSVFAGGWTLDAAEAVCGGDGIEALEVLDLLTRLVEKSLVVYEEQDGEARYRALETVRQYSRDRLLESGEPEVVRERHRDWFVALAERAEPELCRENQATWLARLDAEYDNLRAALEWSLDQWPVASGQSPVESHGSDRPLAPDSWPLATGLRLVGALGRFWQIRGYFSEGREYLRSALLRAQAAGRTRDAHLATPQAKALSWAGFLAVHQGDYAQARSLCEESLALWCEVGDKKGTAGTLGCLAIIAKDQGDRKTAGALFQESLALWREVGDRIGIAGTLGYLGILAVDEADEARARSFYTESLALRRALRDQWGIAASLNNLGLLALHQADFATARALLEESLQIRRELGDKRCMAVTLNNLGLTACGQGDAAAARTLFEESLLLAWEIGDRRSIAYSLEAFACLSAPERGAVLCGAAEALREGMGAPLPPAGRVRYDSFVAAARAALGEEGFAAAWAKGRSLALEEAIHYALEREEGGAVTR